jgi:SAM-dependent methyltransferase
MGVYQSWIVPALTELSMRNARLRPYRERVARAAQGRVLDVGIGSGLNLPFYGPQARDIFGLDPSPRLLARAQDKARDMLIPVRLLEGSAERIPLADRSMDTIVPHCVYRKLDSAIMVRHGRSDSPAKKICQLASCIRGVRMFLYMGVLVARRLWWKK